VKIKININLTQRNILKEKLGEVLEDLKDNDELIEKHNKKSNYLEYLNKNNKLINEVEDLLKQLE
jgi:hypothetical protein